MRSTSSSVDAGGGRRPRLLLFCLLSPVFCLLPACGKTPAGLPATQDTKIQEARRLLAEAGFPEGKGFPKLTILYNTADWHKRIAAAIQERWRSQLGLQLELQNCEWKVFLDRVHRGDYDIARRGYTGEYADPHSLLSLFTTDNGMNTTGWSSPEFDRLIAESDRETDAKKRYAVLARAERLLLDEAPMFTIFHYVGHNWLKPFVKGVQPNPRDMHPLQFVTLEGEGRPADGALIFNAGEEPHSLDPALSDDIGGLKILMHLFEGLANYDPKDALPMPAAAERWEVSPDGKTYTFHLRDARWSNGDRLTAGDFVTAWRRVVDPKTPSSYKDRMYVVKNARAVSEDKALPETLGVRAADERTLVVELEHPAPYFPQLVCLNIFYPVHRATIEKHGERWAVSPETIVGNGPYRMTSWEMNKQKTFERNPRYRAAAEVKLEKFVFRTVGPDVALGFRMYEAGQVHWIFQAPTEFMDKLATRADHISGPTNQCYFYVLNTKVKPLDDPRVRRALSLAINREAIVKQILRGGEMAAHRLTPPLYPGYEVP